VYTKFEGYLCTKYCNIGQLLIQWRENGREMAWWVGGNELKEIVCKFFKTKTTKVRARRKLGFLTSNFVRNKPRETKNIDTF
jgi:hypothetical protein